MPSERIQTTVFDSFAIRDLVPLLKQGTDTIKFDTFCGRDNVGNSIRTNRQVADYIAPYDLDFQVRGWWASSNVGGCALEAWHAWHLATQVTLVVNGKPVWNRALFDLRQTPHYVCPELAEPMPDAGKMLYEATVFGRIHRPTCATDAAARPMADLDRQWDAESAESKWKWNRIATDLDMAPAYVIPGRASVRVSVECDRRATAAFLETMPPISRPRRWSGSIWMAS